ncbi:MAG TPA: hypothetical protein VFN82_08890, partial [Solirubrobacterales bacterium]|nr:hypothetical protein [Solirubrobacterales bacterium]
MPSPRPLSRPARVLAPLLILCALALLAASPAAARKRIGLTDNRSLAAPSCVKPRPAARAKR